MIREYETHRLPDDAIIDWENEYLSYCDNCKKDIILSKDLPKGKYYCIGCRNDIRMELGLPIDVEHEDTSLERALARQPKLLSSKLLTTASVLGTFSVFTLVIILAIDLSKSTKYLDITWAIFFLLLFSSIFLTLVAFIVRTKEN